MTLVGEFGRYQTIACVLVGFICSLTSMTMFSSVFNGAEPTIICKFTNETYQYTYPSHMSCDIWTNKFKNENNTNTSSYQCTFDKTFYDVTYVTEWELVCDKKYLATILQTM